MGSGASILSEEAIKALEISTKFTSKEIISILRRYSYYDPNNTQSISLGAFLSIPEVSANRIMSRVLQHFSAESNTQGFTPSQFVQLLSILSSRTPLETKKEFAFKVLDTNSDGYLGYDELFSFYRMLFGPALSDEMLLNIVMKAIKENSSHELGLTFEDFLELISEQEVKELFTVDLNMP